MEFMVPWMTHNTKRVNLDPQDLLEEMELSDPLGKKETKESRESQVNQELEGPEETWVPWDFLVQWVNLDLQVIMDPQDFQVKWVPWGLPVKKENAVI